MGKRKGEMDFQEDPEARKGVKSFYEKGFPLP